MKLESVAQMFADYRQRVLPADAPAIQVHETCRAFYAAVYRMLILLRDGIGADDMSEDDGIEALEALRDECVAYGQADSPMPALDPAAPTHEQLDRIARAMPDGSPAQLAVFQAVQTMKRNHDAGYEFRASNVVSQRTGEGLLDIVWGGFVGQVTPTKAREIGWILLEAASVAESEAMFMRFLRDRVGVTLEKASLMLHDFRGYRDENPSSLVGTKTDG